MVNTMQLIRYPFGPDADLAPLLFDDGMRYFLFDTAGVWTQIGGVTASEMGLRTFIGRGEVINVSGHASNLRAAVQEFAIGQMRAGPDDLRVMPGDTALDGLLALDYLKKFDIDIDFGTDVLNFFSPDHCPGNVLYWKAAATATLPLATDRPYPVVIPVQLDGHELQALIDTGSSETTLRQDVAEHEFGLTMGDADTQFRGNVPSSRRLKMYRHKFKTLTFGDVSVLNPQLDTLPVNLENRILLPEITIGMDVLRKLHLYIAFKEGKLYVSPASPSPAGSAAPPQLVFDNYIKGLTIMLGWPQHPSDLLTSRCLWRGASGKDLDAALDDCDQSLKQTPQNATALVNRGLVLYRQGKYQEAVAACDAALAADPKQARSFYLRGRSKAKLGDVTGGSSDMAAAQAMDPDTAPALQRMGFFLEPDSKAGSEQDTAKTAAKVSP